MERAASFLAQLEVQLEIQNSQRIVLASGSELHALTAGGSLGPDSRVGRSLSFQVLHATEVPYWTNQAAFQALKASVGDGPIFCETTARGSGDLFWKLWTEPNSYHKVFFELEAHSAYRLEAPVTDGDWAFCQELGFTRQDSAAWFLKAWRESGTDLVTFLHDYPLKPEHAFMVHEGRWIKKDPIVTGHFTLPDTLIKVFAPWNPEHKYVAGVDTAGDTGKDGSAIAVLDRTTGQLVASWKSNTATIRDVIENLKVLKSTYQDIYFVIEKNGVGLGTVQRAKEEGLDVVMLNSTESTKYSGLEAVRFAIEDGKLLGPTELVDECQSLHTDSHGKFKGKKDLLVSCGFALDELKRNPHVIYVPRDPSRHYREPEHEPDTWF